MFLNRDELELRKIVKKEYHKKLVIRVPIEAPFIASRLNPDDYFQASCYRASEVIKMGSISFFLSTSSLE